MPKRFQDPDGPPFPMNRHLGWSIGSNGLTANGQTEILRQLGRQLQSDYQGLLKEPAPDRIKNLLKRLEERGDYPDEEDI
ncbi:NepR family anti-sigma factor [Microvirga sp. 2YAF29]|uniref:NepR family anti-sigma factor n=1 Tax=Microvirga sp. 2YAF29 TaxID=3233031 RepID=UPI003F9884AD